MEQAGFMQVVLGSAMNIAMFVLVVTGVMKLFQAASDLRDMRQIILQVRVAGSHDRQRRERLFALPDSLDLTNNADQRIFAPLRLRVIELPTGADGAALTPAAVAQGATADRGAESVLIAGTFLVELHLSCSVAHLLADELKRTPGLPDAVRAVCRRLTGAFTLVIADADQPDMVVGGIARGK